MSAHLRLAAAACVIAALAAACGSTASPAPSPSAGPASSVAPGVSAEPGASAPGASAPASTAPEPSILPVGDRLLADPAVGRAALPAWRAELVQDVAATRDGTTVERHSTVVHARDASGAEEWIQGTEQTGAEAVDRHVVTIGGAHYAIEGDVCTGEAVDAAADASADAIDPASLLLPILSATAVGSETVNGVAATHYRFDAAGLPIDPASVGGATVAGDAWIADAGGYLVRYALEVTPAAGATGSAATRQSWRYDLTTSPDAPVALPDGCLPVPLDLPATADATDVRRTSGGLAYHAPSTPREVASFYWDRLLSDGWSLPMDAPPAKVEPPFGFNASKGDRTVSVLLTAGEGGGTDVTVVVVEMAAAAPGESPAPTSTPRPGPSPTLPDGIPVYPSTTEVIQAGSSAISGLTDDTPKAVLDWYRGKLKRAGWSLEMSSSTSGTEFAQWTKGSKTVMVVAAPEDGSTRFVVNVE